MKKNDKAYLLDFKVDIKTDNNIYFQELALLFDKPAFLDLLHDLRLTYLVPNLFSLDNFDEALDTHLHDTQYQKTIKPNLSKYSKLIELEEQFPELYEFANGKNDMPEILDAECNLVCFEFNRPTYFVEAIEQAIFCGAVNDKHFKPTEAKVVNFGEMGAWETFERVAIFVSPTSTYDEVKEEFRNAKSLMKSDKRLSYYRPRVDATPNIRKYRNWYWERLSGKTYQQIADDYPNDIVTTDLDVLKAVKTYSKLLTR
ncbi:MAG TPA: hypothetical protein VLH94_02065 [Spirochaetia bacterium]|nr:hypothetical protein [Spirochaetia bacterium]